MKRKMLLLAVVSILLGLLAQTAAFAESMEYSDLVNHLITSWNQEVSKEELTELYGEAFFDAETYLSFWDQEKGVQYSFFFDGGLLASIDVAYVVSSREHWRSAYDRFVATEKMLNETLGKRQGWLYFYNGDERAASDVDCMVNSWNGDSVCVLLAYTQTDTKVHAFTQITAVR